MTSNTYERTCKAIAELTAQEATSVTIYNLNPDFDGPNAKISCNGNWTNWQDEDFDGDSQVDCLEKAVTEKRMAEKPNQVDQKPQALLPNTVEQYRRTRIFTPHDG